MKESISIVLPFFNAGATIHEAIRSVLDQSCEDFELLAVDDGSTDSSSLIVAKLASRDSRIRLLQGKHRGVVAAMNRGIESARFPFIARMDADDRMHPDRLRLQRDFLRQNSEIDLVGSRVELFSEESISDGLNRYIAWQNSCLSPEQIYDELYFELAVANPTILFRREALRFGTYREGNFPEDYELLMRWSRSGVRMAKLPEILHFWRDGPTRLTRTDPRYEESAFDRIRYAYLRKDARLHSGRPIVFWGSGRKTRMRSSILLDPGIQPAAYIDIDPRKIGNFLDGIPVHSPEYLKSSPESFVLAFVRNHGARKRIETWLKDAGFLYGKDFLYIG